MSIDLSKIIIIIIFSAIEPFTQINRQNAKDFLSLLLHFHNNSEYLPPLESDFQKKKSKGILLKTTKDLYIVQKS